MTSLSSMLQLQGLPPLPRSLTGYSSARPTQSYQPPLHSQLTVVGTSGISSHTHSHLLGRPELVRGHVQSVHGRPSPPIPPPRPQSRRSSSSGSSFRASPEHLTNRSQLVSSDVLRGSPRSLSSSPHSALDSGLGRSSADSSIEGRAFVRVVKSPPVTTRLDAQLIQLRNDMNQLRQQDMALLGHLLQIHQGIQDLRNILIPSNVSSGHLFHQAGGTPYHSSHSRQYVKQSSKFNQNPSTSAASSRLSILSSGASKLFSRRSSSDKLMSEAMGHIPPPPPPAILHRTSSRGGGDDSDSVSSLEFGDM